MGCSLEKTLKDTIEIVNSKHYETEFGDGRKKEAEEILRELGVVAQKIREIFDEDMFNKMNKEQDKRQKSGESGYFPYYVVEAWLNDLKKDVLGLLVEGEK